jgi:glycosyltransferase involved in cell wall biosynthesis
MTPQNILHITTWFPYEKDPQLGIFIEKHITQGFTFSINYVLAVIPVQQLEENYIIQTKSNTHYTLIQVQYKENKRHKFLSLPNREKAIKLGVEKIRQLDFHPDKVICHVAEVAIYIAQKHFQKIPRYLIEHWSGFINGQFEKIPFTVRKRILQRINSCLKIFVVSELLKVALQKKGVTPPIFTIPNVIEFQRVKTMWNKSFTFGVVADLNDSIKNISGILDAFLILANDTDCQLTLAGDGPHKDLLLAHPVWTKHPNKTTYLGSLSNDKVLALLPNIDTLIVNSRFETYSMITAEALLSGVPVIATRCGGPENFIENEINGLLIDIDQPPALVDAMQRMINDHLAFNFQTIHASVRTKISTQQLVDTLSLHLNA